MTTPPAEVRIDTDLAARLVRDQHPDLAADLRLVASGWDNTLYRLGDGLCLRLPRRQVAADLVANEHRWLPDIAARLSVPIPTPVRLGRPTGYYPWPWTITRWIDGQSAADRPVADRATIATDLARFMNDMHVPAPSDAPHNPVRGVPLAHRTPAVRDRLCNGAIPDQRALWLLWEQLAGGPQWPGPPLWLHGDPHPANVLLASASTSSGGHAARLAAVLDFGDLTGGDPATDLAAGWMIFDPPARAVFRAHLDIADDATWQRARGWALNMGTAIAASSGDSPRMAAIGAHALQQVLLDA